jgi:hypothetical protein
MTHTSQELAELNKESLLKAWSEIGRIQAINAKLIAALEECITDDPGAACFNTGRKTRRLQAITDIARSAIARAKRQL